MEEQYRKGLAAAHPDGAPQQKVPCSVVKL
jgi:hypothetical protein